MDSEERPCDWAARALSCEGSSETARFGEDEEGSDCIDWERCLLRVLTVSLGLREGDEDGDGGVNIAR